MPAARHRKLLRRLPSDAPPPPPPPTLYLRGGEASSSPPTAFASVEGYVAHFQPLLLMELLPELTLAAHESPPCKRWAILSTRRSSEACSLGAGFLLRPPDADLGLVWHVGVHLVVIED